MSHPPKINPDTPRTNTAAARLYPRYGGLVDVEFARELERENAALKAKLRAYLAEPSIDGRFCRAAMRAELAELSK